MPGLRIAQVTPFPWEDQHEVNSYVAALSAQLRGRGHQVTVLAPSRVPARVRDSRRLIRAGETADVLAIGELLPPIISSRPPGRGRIPAPPVDISRTIEEVLTDSPFDIVHVHEPWAPSASSVALRHSRALNVGTFHAPTERVLSTQVARKFVETFFGRLDARTASFNATAELMRRFFPGAYRVITPGTALPARTDADGPVRIAFVEQEERAALRLFLRALRRLPKDGSWEATVFVPSGAAPVSAGGSRLRDHVTVLDVADEDAVLAAADVVVAASAGTAPAPGLLVRALGAGAVPVASRLAPYEEVVEGCGLLFDPGDADALAVQLARLIAEDGLRAKLAAGNDRERFGWDRVADDFETVYGELVARRHDGRGKPAVAKRLKDRPLIDVDLHMHTDHSWDCATPVEHLLATARDRGLGAIAITDHNEVSGALDAARKAHDYGVKVIVAEEVKTAEQGEVIGLFIEEKIPRGMSMAETIAAIRDQGGLVYVPHPFDRLHSVPDYEHLLDIVEEIDILEVFNPRVALTAFNEEAERFATKYRIVPWAGSDSHVAQGLGSVMIRVHDFDGPGEFLEAMRSADIVRKHKNLMYVQTLKLLQTGGGRGGRAKPTAGKR